MFNGNYFYNENFASKENQRKRYERKREQSYTGSRMHFFRALWENKLEANGFSVVDSTNKKILYDKFVIQAKYISTGDQSKYLNYKGILFVIYHKWSVTSIELKKEHVYFDRMGFFDLFWCISWEGGYGYTPDQQICCLLNIP